MNAFWASRRREALLVAGVSLLGIGLSFAQVNPAAEEERLKKLDSGPKTIDVTRYPADQQKAYKLFSQKCSQCHSIARGINTDMVLPGEWERYVKRMMFKPNSGITNDEGRTLYRFLVYDASVRKAGTLRQKLATLPSGERATAVDKIKVINPSFSAP